MIKPSVERVRHLFMYEPTTGIFTRRVTTSNHPTAQAGYIAGSKNRLGYVIIFVDGYAYKAHRLAWVHTYGEWPTKHIDHIDGNPSNNRIANLRDVSRSANLQNQRKPHTVTTSGFLGVTTSGSRWQANIRFNGNRKYLGVHDTPELAHEAYLKAKRELHEGCTI